MLSLYAANFPLGLLVVGLVGMLHVFMEFPLDWLATTQLASELKRITSLKVAGYSLLVKVVIGEGTDPSRSLVFRANAEGFAIGIGGLGGFEKPMGLDLAEHCLNGDIQLRIDPFG